MFEKVSFEQFLIDYKSKIGSASADYIQEVYDAIKLPKRSTKYSAGYDFCVPVDMDVQAGIKYLVPTGIKCNLGKIYDKNQPMFCRVDGTALGVPDPNNDYRLSINTNTTYCENTIPYLALYPRSSYGIKYGFKINNTVGIIDQDYYNNEDNEGHIYVSFITDKDIKIKAGDKFCQGIICYTTYFLDEIPVEEIRSGGIGSTSK